MLNYLIKKIFIFLISLLFIITTTFFLMKVIPGDPFIHIENLPKEALEAVYHHYGLDQPLVTQYFKYLKGFFTFNFGPSFVYQGQTANQIIRQSFPVTLILGLQSLLLALSGGIFLGIISAINKEKWQDHLSMTFAILVLSLPNFVLATFLQYLFSLKTHLLPVAQWESFSHSILPTIALASLPMAFITRLVRTNFIEVMKQDYIKLAYSKGLKTSKIMIRHAFKNCLIPILSYVGPLTTYLFTGSFVIEKIFAIPGLGMWMILSILARDYTMIMGLVVFYSIILLFINFIVDILYMLIDPRIDLIQKRENYGNRPTF